MPVLTSLGPLVDISVSHLVSGDVYYRSSIRLLDVCDLIPYIPTTIPAAFAKLSRRYCHPDIRTLACVSTIPWRVVLIKFPCTLS